MHTPWRIELLGGLRALQGDLVLTNFETLAKRQPCWPTSPSTATATTRVKC